MKRHLRRVAFLLVAAWLAAARDASPARSEEAAAPKCGRWSGRAPGRAWSTVEEAGRWWLRQPDGTRSYSRGVNTVNGGEPGPKATAGKAYFWKRTFPSIEAWREATRNFLVGLGFDTRGAWSDPAPDMGLPLIPELDLGRNAQLHWFDLFAPDSPGRTQRIARELTGSYRGNPCVIGYFSDNEVGWWNSPIFLWYLRQGFENHTKQALWGLLHETYAGDFARLEADWVPGTGIASFDDLKRAGASLRLRPGGDGIRVVDRFTGMVAERYYRTVHDALRAADPDALIVGDRLPLYYDQDAVRAMAPWVDVISSNYNVDSPDGWVAPYYFDGLRRLANRPVLVSEYFFAARENRSGNRNNGHLMTVETQAQRARGARAATLAFAGFPNVAGAHWFQFMDEPSGGRPDGEDFNMGLVDIAARPYRELTEAMREANSRVVDVHAAAVGSEAPGADAAPALAVIPPAPASLRLDDGTLDDWDKPASRLVGFTAPSPNVPFGDVHLAWAPDGLWLMALASNYLDFDLLAWEGSFPRGESFELRLVVTGEAGAREVAIPLIPRRSSKYAGRYEVDARLETPGTDGGWQEVAPAQGRVRRLDRPLPHIALEAFVSARTLGLPRLRHGLALGLEVRARTFYRERSMAWRGRMVLGQGRAERQGQRGGTR